MSVVYGTLRSAHGAEAIDVGRGGVGPGRGGLRDDPREADRNPGGREAVFQDLSASEMEETLRNLARRLRLSHDRKRPRGAKKPKPKKDSGCKQKHLSTANRLKDQDTRT